MNPSADDSGEFSKLRWRCRRGVKELDVVLERFLYQHYENSSSELRNAFKSLLSLEDPILLDMLINHVDPKDKHETTVMTQLRNLFTS